MREYAINNHCIDFFFPYVTSRYIPWSNMVLLGLSTENEDVSESETTVDDDDVVLDKLRLYCLLTVSYSSSAGKASESFGSITGEWNPKPNSKQALSSSKSSSVTLRERRPLRRSLWCSPFRRDQVWSRRSVVSGDHDLCLKSGGGAVDCDMVVAVETGEFFPRKVLLQGCGFYIVYSTR